MEPITITLETVKEIYEVAKKIQKVYNVSKKMKTVAESEGLDQITATRDLAGSASDLKNGQIEKNEMRRSDIGKKSEFVDELSSKTQEPPKLMSQKEFVETLPTDAQFMADQVHADIFVEKLEDFDAIDDGKCHLERLSKNDKILSDIELSKSLESYSITLPRTGGEWTGEVGNSKWIPDKDYIPDNNRNYSNPEGKTARELLQKHGIDGIPFKNGEPDFSGISKGTVEIERFSENRYGIGGNFDQADEKLALERNCSKQEIKEWRKENQYTWHERSDCRTMDLVPRDIHNWLPHSGGISTYKKIQ